MVSDNNSLWTYACGVYDFGDVKNQCLDLQDIYSANIDIVLWLCWLHERGRHINSEGLSEALRIVGGINQELLNGLRELRAQLTASSSFTRVQEQLVRKHMLAAELAIEKVLLQRLQDLTERLPVIAEDGASVTLFDYLDSLGSDRAGAIAAELLASSRAFWSAHRDEREVDADAESTA